MSHLKLFVFGSPRVEREGQTVDISLRKAIALFVYLAVTNRPHSRDALATMLWPESDQRAGRGNLRRTLYRITSTFETEVVLTTQDTLERNPDADLWLDVEVFQEHVTACLPETYPVDTLATECQTRLVEAVDLYTDDFLAGFTLPDSPEFDEWQFFQTESLRQSLVAVLEQLTHVHRLQQEWEPAIRYAQRRLALDPLHEPLHRELMQLYTWSGQQAAALRQYQECERILEDEFGVPPEDETTSLYEAIRRRDLPAPRAVVTTQPGTATRTIAAPAPRVYNLPFEASPFVGRDAELARIDELLSTPDCRLLTVVGLGGIGKTRLAAAAGRHVAETRTASFADGVVFVPLAGVETGDAVPSAIAKALQISLAGRLEPLTEVCNYLSDKAVLLILDNFEQLVDEAELLTELLAAGPDVKLLVTSREPLYLGAEWRLDVEGLRYPRDTDADEREALVAYEAVQLFVQTAQQMRTDFELRDEDLSHVRRLCQVVAGMPLALKLAATWLRVMPIERIVSQVTSDLDVLTSRLRDVPARQRSIRIVFEHTWNLLSPEEQRAFRAISVFRGGFTEEAAEEVSDVSPWLLAGLVDRRLVQYIHETRYETHELTRQFATEKLRETGADASIHRRYSEYYLGVVVENDAELHGERPTDVVATLKEDLDNIRQAWRWAVGQAEPELVDRAIEPLATFYALAGLLPEGEQAFKSAAEQFDTLPPDDAINRVLCQLLVSYATFAINRSAFEGLWPYIDRAEELAETLQDDLLLADAYFIRGYACCFVGELAEGVEHLRRAVDTYESLGEQRRLVKALNQLGETQARLQRVDDALHNHRRAVEIATELGDLRARALSLSYIGGAYYFKDDYRTALEYYRDAAELLEEVDDVMGVARTVANVGYVTALLGDYDDAVEHVERAASLFRQVGSQLNEGVVLDTLAEIYFKRGEYERARRTYEDALTYMLDTKRQLEEAWVRSNLGRLDTAMGHYDTAEAQLQQALDLLRTVGNPREIAIALGNLGTLAARRGDIDGALAYYDRAIAGLREADSAYHLAHILVEQASALLAEDALDEAWSAATGGLTIARDVGSSPTIFRAELLLARLAHAEGRTTEAVERLQSLLETYTNDDERAALYYALWAVSRESAHAQQALELYRELAAHTPDVLFRERLEELERERGE